MQKKWINWLLLALGLLVGLYFYKKYRVAPSIELQELVLQDESGKPFDISNLRGKKVIMSFYASWCGNCLVELKELSKIKEKELGSVEVICITDESIELLNTFKNAKKYPFTFLKLEKQFSEIGIHSIPVTYIIDENGAIVKEQVGYLHWNDPSTLNHIKGKLHLN